MDLRRKVAQLVFPRADVDALDDPLLRRWVEELGVGGLVIHGGGDPERVARGLNRLQRLASRPLLVTADIEPGPLQSAGATRFPLPMGVAAAGRVEDAHEVGRITAAEARAQGIHLLFAPLADLNSNPANPIVNVRSYGEDAPAVARFVAAHVRGIRAGGALSCVKHFPGHGDTSVDSHLDLPSVHVTAEHARGCELVPFHAAIEAGVDAVMTAHVLFPALGSAAAPATLDAAIVQGLLRGRLGFDGIVFTDALDMGAIVRHFGAADAARRAVAAGADVLLQPRAEDVETVVDALAAEAHADRLDRARLERSLARIDDARRSVGLHRARSVAMEPLRSTVRAETHVRYAQDLAQRSVTVTRNRRDLLPLGTAPETPLVIVYSDEPEAQSAGSFFVEELRSAWPGVAARVLPHDPDPTDLSAVRREAAVCTLVVIAAFVRARAAKGSLALPPDLADCFHHMAAARPTVFASFGNPYLSAQVPSAAAYLLGWGFEDVSQRAVARALAGRAQVDGRLPISLPPDCAAGDGLRIPAAAGWRHEA